MSLEPWETAYQTHAAWAQLDNLVNYLNTGPDRADESQTNHYDRLRWLTSHLTSVRENATMLVSSTALDSLNGTLAQINSALVNWANNGDAGSLALAGSAYTEAVLDSLRGWPVTKDRVQRGLLRAGLDFQAGAAESLESLRSAVDDVKQTAANLEARIAELNTEGDTSLQALRSEIATATLDVTTQTTRLDTALNGLQQTFTQAEAERASAHTTELERLKNDARAAADEAKKATVASLDAQISAGTEHVDVLVELRDQAANLVDAIGLTGTATEYGKYAKQERHAANLLRYTAIASFAGSFALFLVTLLASHVTEHTAWQVVTFKLAGSIALLALGAYASYESSDHRKEERHAKSVQLDLAALDPFIVNLDPDQQKSIKAAAARRLFAGDVLDDARSPRATAPATFDSSDLTNSAVTALKDIALRSNGHS
jgi:hypothetical protein